MPVVELVLFHEEGTLNLSTVFLGDQIPALNVNSMELCFLPFGHHPICRRPRNLRLGLRSQNADILIGILNIPWVCRAPFEMEKAAFLYRLQI